VRCLKRHLSNVIFRQLVADQKRLSRRSLDNIEGLVSVDFFNRMIVRKDL